MQNCGIMSACQCATVSTVIMESGRHNVLFGCRLLSNRFNVFRYVADWISASLRSSRTHIHTEWYDCSLDWLFFSRHSGTNEAKKRTGGKNISAKTCTATVIIYYCLHPLCGCIWEMRTIESHESLNYQTQIHVYRLYMHIKWDAYSFAHAIKHSKSDSCANDIAFGLMCNCVRFVCEPNAVGHSWVRIWDKRALPTMLVIGAALSVFVVMWKWTVTRDNIQDA